MWPLQLVFKNVLKQAAVTVSIVVKEHVSATMWLMDVFLAQVSTEEYNI